MVANSIDLLLITELNVLIVREPNQTKPYNQLYLLYYTTLYITVSDELNNLFRT